MMTNHLYFSSQITWRGPLNIVYFSTASDIRASPSIIKQELVVVVLVAGGIKPPQVKKGNHDKSLNHELQA
jgi:hypothetical protein